MRELERDPYTPVDYLESKRTLGCLVSRICSLCKCNTIAIRQNKQTADEIGLPGLIETFEPQPKHHLTGAKRLLILDGHSSYLTAEFDYFCNENAIICLFTPPHTSYLLQTLDVGVFGPPKRAYGKLTEEMMTVGNNYIDKEDFLYLYLSGREKVFTQENICHGSVGSNLKPFDKDRVLENFTFQLRTPTPPLVGVESSTSAFRTLRNPP